MWNFIYSRLNELKTLTPQSADYPLTPTPRTTLRYSVDYPYG